MHDKDRWKWQRWNGRREGIPLTYSSSFDFFSFLSIPAFSPFFSSFLFSLSFFLLIILLFSRFSMYMHQKEFTWKEDMKEWFVFEETMHKCLKV